MMSSVSDGDVGRRRRQLKGERRQSSKRRSCEPPSMPPDRSSGKGRWNAKSEKRKGGTSDLFVLAWSCRSCGDSAHSHKALGAGPHEAGGGGDIVGANPVSPVIKVSLNQVVTTGASKARRKEEESRRGAAAAGRGAHPVQCCRLHRLTWLASSFQGLSSKGNCRYWLRGVVKRRRVTDSRFKSLHVPGPNQRVSGL